jgi:glycosyltransferase involved in cell wall biosynthesis
MNECALPQVSVLMAVHNGLPHLHEAIRSILAQTFGDFEFVIVDDGSTDGTSALLAEYAASDDRIRLLTNERNLGLTPSLNVGLRASRAPLVARQDADDVSLPGRLAAQTAFMDAHPEVALLGTVAMLIDDAGRCMREPALPLSDAAIRWQLLFGNPFCHSSAMFRRDCGDVPVCYDESFRCSQDYELWSRLQDCGRMRNLPEPLVKMRRHAASVSLKHPLEQARLACRISSANMGALVGKKHVDEGWAGMLRLWFECPPRRLRQSISRASRLQLKLLAAFVERCPSDSSAVRDEVVGRVAMALTGARGDWAKSLRYTVQTHVPDANLTALAEAAERKLRESGDWGRGLRWRAWQSARGGCLRDALRNLRHAVTVSPRLLLSPRTWLVPVRALLGCLHGRAR